MSAPSLNKELERQMSQELNAKLTADFIARGGKITRFVQGQMTDVEQYGTVGIRHRLGKKEAMARVHRIKNRQRRFSQVPRFS
jgi:hypothetical protein